MNELMAQLKFPVRREDVKKRVESLLDREYLERGTPSARRPFFRPRPNSRARTAKTPSGRTCTCISRRNR